MIEPYLELTKDQMEAVWKNNVAHGTWAMEQYERMSNLEQAIDVERSKDPLDAGAMGARFVEKELIHREIAKRDEERVGTNRKLLTEVQRAKLRALVDAIQLSRIGWEAEMNGLIARAEVVQTENRRKAEDRNLIASAPWSRLKTFLVLTDGQYANLLALHKAHDSWVYDLQIRLGVVQEEIRLELAKEQLDGNAIGIRYVEIGVTERAIKERASALGVQLRTMLTEAQLAKLKVLEEARKLSPEINEAASARFIEPEPCVGNGIGGFFIIDPSTIGAVLRGCY